MSGKLSAITGLKDSLAKRNELSSLMKEMSLSFLSVLYGKIEETVSLIKKLIEISGNVENGNTKVQEMAAISYANATKKGSLHVATPNVQIQSGKTVQPEPTKAIIITPITPGEEMSCEQVRKTLLTKTDQAQLE